MKSKNIHIFIFLINAVMSWVNMCYFADNVARTLGGYFVALGVIPFIIGLLTSYIGTLKISKGFMNRIKENWSIFIAAELGEFVPIGYVILVLS